MIGLRATPKSIAAFATAEGISQMRRGSKGSGDDVVGAITQAPAIDFGHRVGHVGARQFCKRMGRRDFHRLVDGPGLNVKRAAEDVWEAEDVVDLVGIVRTACGDDSVIADLSDFFRRDFGVGVRHGEDDGLVGHAGDHLLRQRSGGRKTEENICALNGFGKRPRFRVDRVGRFPLVHALFAAPVDDAGGIAKRHILVANADRLHEFKAGDAGRARAIADELDIRNVAPRQMQGVDQSGGRNDGRAVLVVMENGNVHQLAQPALNDETVRRLDVFQVDAAP